MTAIEGLLKATGRINGSGMKGLGRALGEMADLQSSMADAITPMLAAVAVLADLEPFVYGFELPAEIPPIRADAGSEQPAEAALPAAVSLGPINIYAVAREIQKTLGEMTRETTSVPAIYSRYTGPEWQPSLVQPPAERHDLFAPGSPVTVRTEVPGPQPPEADRRQPAPWAAPAGTPPRHAPVPGPGPEAQRSVPSATPARGPVRSDRAPQQAPDMGTAKPAAQVVEAPAEKSVRKSLVVMEELNEIYRNIVSRTITVGQAGEELSSGALSVGPAAAAAVETPRISHAAAEAPGHGERPSPFSQSSPVQAGPSSLPGGREGLTPPEDRGPGEARSLPAPAAGSIPHGAKDVAGTGIRPGTDTSAGRGGPEKPGMPSRIVIVPPIMPARGLVPPAEEAGFNAEKLSQARASGAESLRGPEEFFERKAGEEVRAPERTASGSPGLPGPGPAGRVPPGNAASGTRGSSPSMPKAFPEPAAGRERPAAALPVAAIARSMTALQAYITAAAAIVPTVAFNLASSHAGGLEVATILASGISVADGPGLVREAGAPAAAGASGSPDVSGIVDDRFSWAPGASVAPPLRGRWQGIQSGGASAAAMSVATGIAATQAVQRSGMAMIQEVLQSATPMPTVTGSPAQAVREAWRNALWGPQVSPLSASGGENIVNVTVPRAAPPANEGMSQAAASKVANFHNSFNITVNVKGGEEGDLRQLGKKIGQILSDEIKRYGGIG